MLRESLLDHLPVVPPQVSAVVRGTPLECLRVLLNPHDSTTTILGPATEVEVLESEQARQVSTATCDIMVMVLSRHHNRSTVICCCG